MTGPAIGDRRPLPPLGRLFVHLAFLTGFRNRLGAVLTWAAAFASDARRERAFTTQQIERLHDVHEPALPARATPDGESDVPQA